MKYKISIFSDNYTSNKSGLLGYAYVPIFSLIEAGAHPVFFPLVGGGRVGGGELTAKYIINVSF
jgi:hypothetical protein